MFSTICFRRLVAVCACFALASLAACGSEDSSSSGAADTGDLLDTSGDAGGDDVGGEDSMTQTDGSDDAGPEDTGPDDSGTEDTGPEPDVDLPDEFFPPGAVPEICDDLCADIEDACDEITIDGMSCEDACAERLDEDQEFIGSFICIELACDVDACIDDEPAPLTGDCVDFCSAIRECDLEDEFEFPSELGLCEAACAGIVAGDGLVAESIGCIADSGLGAGMCSEELIAGCTGEPVDELCADICTDLDCAEDSAFTEEFGDVEGCIDACADQPDFELLVAFSTCLDIAGCEQADACADLPDEVSDTCDEACDALDEVCPIDTEGELDPDTACRGVCTAVETVVGGSNEDAASCIEDFGGCPGPDPDDPGGESFELLAQCVVPSSEACESLCDGPLTECTGDPLEECVSGCSFLEVSEPEIFGEVEDCVDEAGDDCEAIFDCVDGL